MNDEDLNFCDKEVVDRIIENKILIEYALDYIKEK